jgi:DNA-binding NarL/FixJ family response regulator
MSLVGREVESTAMRAAVDAAAGGGQPVIVLRGEAGIGKTGLLGVLAEQAERRRFVVRLGRATELESDAPLALFRGAIELPVADESAPDSRWQRLATVAAALDAAHPVVLILDDLHWADPASLELVDLLLRRPPRSNHLFALGIRPGEVADAAVAACRASGRDLHLFDLPPLSRAAAEQLLGPDRTREERDDLYERAGGNPLLLQELGRGEGGAPVPRGIVAAVAAELGSLDDDAVALARAGSLLGDPFDLDIARVVAGLDLDRALAAVDRLMVQGLARGGANLKEYRFRHPVFRTAIYEGQPRLARLLGHDRAARALAAAGRPLVDQARHLAHTVAPGSVADAATLRAAAQQVRGQAPSIAADWFLAAKRSAPPTDLAEFSDLAELLVQSGRQNQALAIADEGLSFGSGSSGDRARLQLAAGAVERQLGAHEAARRRLARALDEGCLVEEITAALALGAYERGDYPELAHWSAAARSATGPLVQAAAAAMHAMMLGFSGDVAQSRAEAEVALMAIREATDLELASHADLMVAATWALVAIESLEDVLIVAPRSAAAAHGVGNLVVEVPLLLAEVLALGLLGRTTAAAAAADRAEVVARLAHADQPLQWALWMRAWVRLELGDLDTALLCARESVALAQNLDRSALVTVANAVLGSVLLAHGRALEAVPLLAAYDVEPGWICRWSPRLVEAQLATGDAEGARRTAAHATSLAEQSGLAGALAGAALARALAAGGAEAAEHAERAIGHATAIGADLDAAAGHLIAGQALGVTDRPRALEHLSAAYALADAGGMRRTADSATRELRRLGRRVGRGGPRSAAGTGIESLSTRERELADLVAAGLTNRQIAARLFLSEKTVESHLSRAFTKLGVTARAALAAAVAAAED